MRAYEGLEITFSSISSKARGSSSIGDDLVDTDVVVCEAGEQNVTVLVPGQGGAANGGSSLLIGVDRGNLDVSNELLRGEIQNLDALLGTDDQPVLLGSEEDNVHGAVHLLLSEELALDEVPNDNEAVLATRGQEGGLRDHGERVDLSLVADKGVLKSHSLVVPHLDRLVPGGADNNGGLAILEELDGRNPVGVGALLNGELALAHGVPDLEVLVSAAAGNLSVVGGEGDGEHVSRVADESLDGVALLEVPQAEGAVPRAGEDVSAVLREGEVAHEVRVA